MKIAYLITAYGEWVHLERLVGALRAPGADFFIHIDARSRVPEDFVPRLEARGDVFFAPRRAVWWGGWSHTAAILSLMELATEHSAGNATKLAAGSVAERSAGFSAVRGTGYDYCVVLSGGDYPIRSNRVIFETLASGGEFINAVSGFRPDKPESRVSRYWFDGFDRRRPRSPKALITRAVELSLRLLGIRKRRYPFGTVWSGIVWGALSGPCVRYILDYVRAHPEYVRFFRTALVPEEMFFATIVGNSPFAADIRGTLTYMDWDHSSASPPLIDADRLPRLAPGVEHFHPASGRSYERLFARKFDDLSGELLDRIDAEFRR